MWLPQWPVQRLLAARPELKDRAVALYQSQPRGTVQIVGCSAAASGIGLHVGMPLAEALARVEHLHVEAADPLADRQALVALAQWCQRYSPIVGLEEAERPEGLLLDVTGLAHLFGSETALAQQATRQLKQRRLDAVIVIADTVGAAWAIAKYGSAVHGNTECGNSACRKPASEIRNHPSLIVPPHRALATLSSLPPAALRLDETTLEILAKLGIERIAQLAALPRAALRSRFGPQLLQRLDQATGRASEVIVAVRAAPDFSAEWTWEHATDNAELLNQIMASLLERLTIQLNEQDRGALRVACRMTVECCSPVILEIGLFEPSARPEHLLGLFQLQLEQLRLPGRVSGVCLRVIDSGPIERRQQQMFSDPRHASNRCRQAVLFDQLASRLGHQAVLRVYARADAQPERAWRAEPLVHDLSGAASRRVSQRGATKRAARPSTSSTTSEESGPLTRPLQLLARPARLDVVAVVPDGPPIRFRYLGEQHHVVRHWGPERIETGWWRRHTGPSAGGRGARRDYWRVETTAGRRFWLFRNLRNSTWFFHGEFA